ncbi:MAG: aminotransferase class I/II-fold pyridoxal phosphate-dependent enzyme [Proteobacteria bacterium]|nr:aminotransferase class I/II-fold pyridoxal phosphate-dependent enzyme [Pseudomonadota bacterium]
MPTNVDTSSWSMPINLGLNDGTYCSQAAIDVLQEHSSRTSLRNYSNSENSELKALIAQECGCSPDMVYLHNGSGPILKQVLPHIIRSEIKSKASRIVKHLISKQGYPIITPVLTYGKVPLKAIKSGLTVRLVPLLPDNDYTLDIVELEAAIKKGDGLVYIANPNNPTGNVLVTREQMEPLFKRYPNTTFWMDEAYVQYVSEQDHPRLVDFVAKYPNVVCTRTFSFAFGMAAVRIGYIICRADLVAELEGQVTDYRIPLLSERMGVTALKDGQHLADVRERTDAARAYFGERMAAHPSLKVFPSVANFVLVQTKDGDKAKAISAGMLERGVKIKTFAPLKEHTFGDIFRITVGTPEENEYCMDMLDEVMA